MVWMASLWTPVCACALREETRIGTVNARDRNDARMETSLKLLDWADGNSLFQAARRKSSLPVSAKGDTARHVLGQGGLGVVHGGGGAVGGKLVVVAGNGGGDLAKRVG